MPKIILSLFLIAALGGCVAVAAHDTAPGDILYPFKIDVTERIEHLLAFSPSAQADLAVNLADERLQEIGLLVSTGLLTSETSVKLIGAFDTEAARAATLVGKLHAAGDLLNASRNAEKFQAELGTRIAEFSSVNTEGLAAMQTLLTPIIAHVQSTLDTVSALNGTIEGGATK